jgi:flagellar protein FlaG
MGISSITMSGASQAADFQPQAATPSATGNASASGATSQSQQGEPTQAQLNHAVNQINDVIQTSNKDVLFSVDNQSGRFVVKVMDTQTNEVIRQIPSKETLAIADALGKLQGIILKQQA